MATGTATVTRNELCKVAEDAFYGFKSTHKEPDRQKMLSAADALAAYLDSTGTPHSADEAKLLEAVVEIGGREHVANARLTEPEQPNGNGTPPSQRTAGILQPARTTWQDQHGNAVYCLARNDRLIDTVRPVDGVRPADLSIGRLIVATKTGRWDRAPLEIKALAGNTGGSGSVLVPHAVAAAIIDKARSRTVVMQAGALTIPMTSETMTIARVSTDATMTTKTPGEKWTQTDMAFAGVGLTAYTFGCVLAVSNELMQDAPNISDAIDTALAGKMAVEIDRLALAGTGSGEPNGLLLRTDVSSTGSIGAIAWEDIAAASVAVRVANHEPNAYVTSPTIAGDLAALTSGDGTNSAKLWLGPPPNVAPLLALQTSSCPDAKAAIGDFTRMLIGVRLDMQIAMSDVAGESFERNQTLVRVVWRGDVNLADPSAFALLTGITT